MHISCLLLEPISTMLWMSLHAFPFQVLNMSVWTPTLPAAQGLCRLSHTHTHTQHFSGGEPVQPRSFDITVGHFEQYASNNNFKTKKIKHTSSIDTNVRVPWLFNKRSRQFTEFQSDVPQQPWVESLFCLYSPTVCGSCSVVVTIPKAWELPWPTPEAHKTPLFLCAIKLPALQRYKSSKKKKNLNDAR